MGEKLARKILALAPSHDIDIVMPIPETSRTSALQCANILQVFCLIACLFVCSFVRSFVLFSVFQHVFVVRINLDLLVLLDTQNLVYLVQPTVMPTISYPPFNLWTYKLFFFTAMVVLQQRTYREGFIKVC